MCKYCKNVDTGDDYNPILSAHIDFGFFGNVDADVYLRRAINGNVVLDLSLCEDDGSANDSYINFIKYCPMCGRKLVEGDD